MLLSLDKYRVLTGLEHALQVQGFQLSGGGGINTLLIVESDLQSTEGLKALGKTQIKVGDTDQVPDRPALHLNRRRRGHRHDSVEDTAGYRGLSSKACRDHRVLGSRGRRDLLPAVVEGPQERLSRFVEYLDLVKGQIIPLGDDALQLVGFARQPGIIDRIDHGRAAGHHLGHDQVLRGLVGGRLPDEICHIPDPFIHLRFKFSGDHAGKHPQGDDQGDGRNGNHGQENF